MAGIIQLATYRLMLFTDRQIATAGGLQPSSQSEWHIPAEITCALNNYSIEEGLGMFACRLPLSSPHNLSNKVGRLASDILDTLVIHPNSTMKVINLPSKLNSFILMCTSIV